MSPGALPGYGVAMVVVSPYMTAGFDAVAGAEGPSAKNDHDQGQTRRQETEAGHVAN
jgi:hypothetical protein